VAQRDLARAEPAARPADLAAAEERVRALVEEVAALDAGIDALADDLAAFERSYAAATAEASAELHAAERLLRRVERLEAELARLREAASAPGRRATASPFDSAAPPARLRSGRTQPGACAASAPGAGPAASDARGAPPSDDVKVLDAGDLDLRRLRQRLARLLHPDLAQDDGERARAGALMARVNEAYAQGDRAGLELLAERLGAAAIDADVADEDRRAHLERRAAALAAARGELSRERARLAASGAGRLREEARRRAEAGGDLAREGCEAARARAADARDRALSRLDGLVAAARDLGRARAASLRAALAASALVRAPARDGRPSAAAAALARALAADARAPEPWEAALTVLAFLCEAAGVPPDALASRDALAARWEALRAGWRSAPDLGGALARLPRGVELGLRAAPTGLAAGLQLAAPDLAAGVRLALEDEPVRALARRALAVLGPRERCAACDREAYAMHLVRARGLDEIHGLACPRCGAVLRSYWRYGPADGLEALAPVALAAGALAEVEVRLGGARLAFQVTAAERARLTVRDLDARLRELLLAPHGLEPAAGAIRYRAARALLAPDAHVPATALTASVAGGAAAALVAEVRARVARRFRA
jgi:hypothetical protein